MSTTDPPRRLRIALAHDWLCGYRGGEAVLERIAQLVEREHEAAALYTMFDDGQSLSPAVDRLRAAGLIHSSSLSRIPGGAGSLRRWLLPLYPMAVAELSRALAREHAQRPIDLLISTSSAAIKGLRPPAGVPHLCYCHAPARYVWSRSEEYAGGLRGLGLKVMGGAYRAWDARTASRVTMFLANSTHTARQIQRCYGREASVVFPPVRTEFFTPGGEGEGGRASITAPPGALQSETGSTTAASDGTPGSGRAGTEARLSVSKPTESRGTFWLVVSALEPYKRIDLAIEAAARAGVQLVIAGKGSQREKLESLARARGAGRVRFAGRVEDDELRELYRSARLLLFPQVEDFGIVAAEALACGLPVVARAEGGALDIVQDGITGALFREPNAAAIVAAAKRAPEPSACSRACRAKAMQFTEERFDREMRDAVARVLNQRTDA